MSLQDGTLEVIDGATSTLVSLSSVDLDTQDALKKMSQDDSDEDGSNDTDTDTANDECEGEDSDHEDDIMEGIFPNDQSGSRSSGQDCKTNNDADDDDNDGHFDMVSEFVENFEANQSSTADSSDKVLAAEAVAESFSNMDDYEDDKTWVAEQIQETMEKERDRVEIEIASTALSSGAKIEGNKILQIAQEVLAETCLDFDYHAGMLRSSVLQCFGILKDGHGIRQILIKLINSMLKVILLDNLMLPGKVGRPKHSRNMHMEDTIT